MKIVVLDGFTANPGDLSWDGIAQYGDLTVYERTPDPADVIPRIGDAEIVYTNKIPISAEVMDACKNIRMICLLATGYNIVDINAARKRGIDVCNIPSYSTASVAQLTIALLLELCHHVGDHSRACHDGTWTNGKDFCFWLSPLRELDGKTLGIIGYGRIGQAVGRIAQALGMKLLVNAHHVRPELESETCKYVSLDELLKNSDVITLHCPQFPETTGLINKDTIAKMKDGVLFLNTSRGGLIVEQDVADALRSGKIAGAGIDALIREPITFDNPLFTAPNLLLTPHFGWAPFEARVRLLQIAEDNLRCFLEGKPINVVN